MNGINKITKVLDDRQRTVRDNHLATLVLMVQTDSPHIKKKNGYLSGQDVGFVRSILHQKQGTY